MNLQIVFILAMVGVLLIGIYLFWHFKKLPFIACFHKKKWISFLLAAGLTILCILGAVNIFSFRFVIVFFLFQMYLLTDLIHLILCKCIKNEKLIKGWKKAYCGGILCFALAAIYIFAGYKNAYNVQNTTYEVHTDKLSKEESLTIAMVADLHFGTTLKEEKLKTYCQEISDKNVDLVLLVGDIVDHNTTKDEIIEAFQALGRIQSTYGVYYVYGNHDVSYNYRGTDVSKSEFSQYITDAGITILEDNAILINNQFYIIGREDIGYTGSSNRTELTYLTKDLDPNKYWILMDHQPKEIQKAKDCGIDLMVSGHTHGGQLWPIGIFSKLLGIDELIYGDKEIDGFHAIVTSGIGGWGYPVRTGSKAEIVYITVIGDGKNVQETNGLIYNKNVSSIN